MPAAEARVAQPASLAATIDLLLSRRAMARLVWRADFIDVVRWLDAMLVRDAGASDVAERRAPLRAALLRLLAHCGS